MDFTKIFILKKLLNSMDLEADLCYYPDSYLMGNNDFDKIKLQIFLLEVEQFKQNDLLRKLCYGCISGGYCEGD